MSKESKKKRSHIITAWAERCAGPGWANSLIHVIFRQPDGQLIKECFQPDEQTAEMKTLFDISVATNTALLCAISKKLYPEDI